MLAFSLFLQYIPDVSRAVFGLLAAMQKRARESEEDAGASKRLKGSSSAMSGPKVLHLLDLQDHGELLFSRSAVVNNLFLSREGWGGSLLAQGKFLYVCDFFGRTTCDVRQA